MAWDVVVLNESSQQLLSVHALTMSQRENEKFR